MLMHLMDLKVGDHATDMLMLVVLTVKPIKGLRIQGLYKMYSDNHYADWSHLILVRLSGDADRVTSLESTPSYNKLRFTSFI